MKRIKKAIASSALAGMVLTLIPLNVLAAGAVPTRLSGNTAAQTSVQIAEQTGWTGTAILASSTSYGMVDALTAGPLSTFLKAPILLTEAGNVLNPDTQAELIKLKVTTLFVTSGTGVISQAVLDQLKSMGITVVPLGGVDRFATAANIANKMVLYGAKVSKVAVAYGWKNQDALSIASIASAQSEPILLTEKDSIPASVKEFLTTNPSVKVTDLIGGTGVISDSVKAQLPSATRYFGNSAYDTNLEVLKAFDSVLKYDNVFIANGETAIDALAGAPLAAKYNAGIVLTKGVANAGTAYVSSKLSSSSVVTALGGTAVVPEAVRTGIANATPIGGGGSFGGGFFGGILFGGGVIGGGIVAVDKTQLSSAISAANSLLASKTVGTAVGNISPVSKTFQAAIDAATTVNAGANVSQAQVDGQIVALATASNNLYAAVLGAGAAITGLNGTIQLGETTSSAITAATTEAGAGTWISSIPEVATVDASTGVITVKAAGITTISYTTSTSGHVNSQVITIYAAATVTNLTIGVVQLGVVAVSPTGYAVPGTGQTIAWTSSNPVNATVNATTGVITPEAQGDTTISYAVIETATGRVVARGSLPITVQAARVLGEAVTGLTSALQLGEAITATAESVEPGAGTWTSSTPAVATVNGNTGAVTALTPGTTTIAYTTSTSGNVNAQAITVYTAATAGNLTIGAVQVGAGNVMPTGYTAPSTGQMIAWTSSALFNATIDGTGLITPLAPGNTTISYAVVETATTRVVARGSSQVAVQASTAGVTLNKTSTTMLVGTNETLVATLQGINAAVTWTSDNPAVATVDSTGKVVCVGLGIPAKITATTVVGNLTATCEVTPYTAVMAIDAFNAADYALMSIWITSYAPAIGLNLTAYNALSTAGQSVVLSALTLSYGLTTKAQVQAAIDSAILAWHEPPAPAVTRNDTANTVSGMGVGMEYSLDAGPYVVYDSATFVNSFPGDHTLLVRVADNGINPASADTELTFTTP
ncbi:MAG TPA: cell wall-binding repeat-containing protein [Desulfosporosinus sp.]